MDENENEEEDEEEKKVQRHLLSTQAHKPFHMNRNVN